MPAKNWRGKRHPGLVWRVLFGHNGPTRGELKKLLGLTFSKTFDVQVRDPATGRVQKKRMRIGDDGRIQEVKAPAKKKGKKGSAAKRPAAKKPPAGRAASKTSKPSRTSKSGSTQQRRQPSATSAPRRARAEPLAERVLRNPDGTLAGSRKQKPVTYAQAQREIAKAMRSAEAASKHAEELLEWEIPQRRPRQ
jgi:hypothetical protein